jgi:hypothetical protein
VTPEERRDGDDPALDPTDEQSLRDLLRSAHATPSTPPAVAARLDEVLAGLVSERAEPAPEQTPVVDLAERRRRRWPKVLVAAAAVSVIGLGVGNLIGDFGSPSAQNSTAGGAAESAARDDAGSAPQTKSDAPSQAPGRDGEGKALTRLGELQGLRSESLAGDAQRFADVALVTPFAADERRSALPRCEAPETQPGDEVFAVRLDGQPATLVFRKAENGVRQTDIYPCEDPAEPAGTTFVNAK